MKSALRHSKHSSRPRICYCQYDFLDLDTELGKARKSDASGTDASSNAENDTELTTLSKSKRKKKRRIVLMKW